MKNNLSKHIIKVFVVFLTGAFVFVASCKKEEPEPCPCDDPFNIECPNYDSCYGVTKVSADFDILEQISPVTQWSDSFTLSKDVTSFGNIKFKAKEQDASSYTWFVGSEKITGVSEVMRLFRQPSLSVGDVITVTLVVEREPSVSCFPNDNGIDTVTKYFTLVDPCDYWIDGVFRGAWLDEQSTDSFNIRFAFVNRGLSTSCSSLKAWNLNNQPQCDSAVVFMDHSTTTYMNFSAGTLCGEPFGSLHEGVFEYDVIKRSVVIHYTYNDWDSVTQDIVYSYKIFSGYRVN